MKLHDLHPFELFDVQPARGLIRLSAQRYQLLSVAATGLHQRDLVAALGARARPLLLRYGYAQGYFDALCAFERMRDMPLAERFVLGATVHTLVGTVRVEPLRAEWDGRAARVETLFHDGSEAEQHRRAFGPADGPSCYVTTGYASGFASGATGLAMFFREHECQAAGARACRLEGRDAASWPDAAAFEAELRGPDGSSLEELQAELRRLAAEVPPPPEAGQGAVMELGRAGDAVARRHNFIVRSRAVSDLLARAERVAPLDSTVLVHGESGTGKEFLVRFIHERSPRATEPFVVVNCAALSEPLLESELFGHVKGAFTGAVRDKPGLLEHAGRGTVFLDEIGELTPGMQGKLLRALENREIRRVGGERDIRVQARLVAATHRDLAAAVRAGTFREDLWFRLGAFVLEVPPLRERREDIAPLAHYFLHDTAARLDKPVHTISAEAMGRLLRDPWPGNVRELRHAVEQAVVFATGDTVGARELPHAVGRRRAQPGAGDLDVKANERALIEEALRRFEGNKTRAAQALKMSPVTLWRRAKRYGLR